MAQATGSSKQHIISDKLREEILQGAVNEKLPTEKELSKRFNCSTGTISKAVAILVHEGLVERKPRGGTRILRNRDTIREEELSLNAYAFICPSDQHEGLWRMLRGFQERANLKGRRTVILTSNIDSQKEMELIRRLSEFEVQGAVIYPMAPSFNHLVQFAKALQTSTLPIVLAGSSLSGMSAPSVIVDGFHAGYSITQHMIKNGLKRIGFISDRAWSVSMRDRSLGYRWAMRNAGLSISEKTFLMDKTTAPDFQDTIKFPVELAHRYIDRGALEELDGIVCSYDILAYGLLQALKERGIDVPTQIQVAGVDDFDSRNEQLGLTSYRVSFEDLGAQSFDLLERQIMDKETCNDTEILISGKVIARQTA